MDNRLEGKVALVTGGMSGIGAGTVERLVSGSEYVIDGATTAGMMGV